MKKVREFGLVNLIALVLVIITLSFIPTAIVINRKSNLLDNLTNEEQYLGIIEIWHIDTFEGGTTSKEVYLNSVSKSFTSRHKGTYVHITNLSEDGLIEKLNSGLLPDLFSFGYGIGDIIFKYLKEIDVNAKIIDSLDNSSIYDYKRYAVPYTFGGYFMFSTEENISKAGKEVTGDLINNYNGYGYTYSTRKRDVSVLSISFGENEFISPLGALYYATNRQKTGLSTNISPYDAYVGFVGFNSSTILLGSHRDLARLKQKQDMGKLSGLIVNYTNGYTDLVQYLAVANTGDSRREALAIDYINLSLSEESQETLKDIGMFSVLKNTIIYDGIDYYSDFESQYKKDFVVPNVFETKDERLNRKMTY